jgi:enoyl-CoA hydratase/carnithine racemase
VALVETELTGHALIVRFTHPPVNALSRQMREVILETLRSAESEGAVHAVVMTGGGAMGFSAGADLRESAHMTSTDLAAETAAMELRFCGSVCRFSKPLIAAIDRYALGGGCELALAADWRFASSRAKLGFPEATLGGFPAGGAIPLATRVLGPRRARQLMMSAEILSAQEALRIGLVDGVVEPDALLERAIQVAKMFADRPYAPIRVIKSLTADDIAGMADLVLQAMRAVYAESDIHEGLRAFLEKRPPIFQPQWVADSPVDSSSL